MNNKPIEYFDVTHFGRCSDSECPDSTVGSYGRYSTYEKAKARFDKVVDYYINEEHYEPTRREEDFFKVGDDYDGFDVGIERKTLELDVDDNEFGV